MFRYELCHHMNDIRTCPRSALNLVDSKGRIQNCESEENVCVSFNFFFLFLRIFIAFYVLLCAVIRLS